MKAWPWRRHIGGEHADLAIGDLARRARVLARNATRRLALFQKAGLINDKNSLLISERFQRVIAYDVPVSIDLPFYRQALRQNTMFYCLRRPTAAARA